MITGSQSLNQLRFKMAGGLPYGNDTWCNCAVCLQIEQMHITKLFIPERNTLRRESMHALRLVFERFSLPIKFVRFVKTSHQ
jgi:hypothetical protein